MSAGRKVRWRWGIILAAGSCGLGGCATSVPGGADPSGIEAVLERQAEAWNRGDIEAFMGGYVRSDRLRFVGASGVRRGWDATLARYRASYPDRAAMGRLSFEDLEIEPLSPRHAEVFGRYRLERGAPHGDAVGYFTLLAERTPDGWRIVHDHSSAAEQ